MRRFLHLMMALAALAAAWATTPLLAHEEQTTPERIVVVGDLHGDFEAWKEIAQAAGIMDAKGRWTGGEAVLVQMGDVTDRGPDSLKIIRSLQALEGDAPVSGGRVIVLLGNHEAMNVIGDLRYVHGGEYAAFVDRKSKRRREGTWLANQDRIIAFYLEQNPAFSVTTIRDLWFDDNPLGKLEHRRAWSPGGELAQWAAARPAVARIGGTLFAHGGVSAERSNEPIATINAKVAAALAPGEGIDRSVLEDPLGPLWYRGNVARVEQETDPESARIPIAQELDQVLAAYSARRLVVAHTPSLEGIVASQGGKLIRVDTGISAHYGGPASYLEILGDKVIAHQRQGDGSWALRELAAGESSAQ